MSKERKKFNLNGKLKEGLAFWGKPILIGIVSGGLLLGAKFGIADPIMYRAFKNDLPTFEEANENLDATGYNTDITWYENNRFVFPSDGKVKVNVFISEDMQTERFKIALEDSINEINEVLNLINPKYSLEINYDPGLFDKLYCFNLYAYDLSNESTDKSRVVGTAKTKDTYDTKNGEGKYAVDIAIDLDYCNNTTTSDTQFNNYVKNVLCHEIAGHGLASLKDAYNLEYYPYQTIMESNNSSSSGLLFSKSDLMIMFSLYSNDTNYSEWENKIDNYLASKPFYIDLQEKIDYVKDNFYNEYVVKNELQDYIKPDSIQFENIGDIYIKSVSNQALSYSKGNYYQNRITYKGLKSTDKIEEYNCSSVSFDFISQTKYNNSFYNLNGVSCSNTNNYDKNIYVKIGENTIVAVRVSYDANAELVIKDCYTYDIITKETYEKETKSLEETIKQIGEVSNDKYIREDGLGIISDVKTGCVDIIKEYLNKNNYKFKEILDVKNEMHGITLDGTNVLNTLVINNESIFVDDDKYYYSVDGGFIFCSNGKVFVLLENNYLIELELGINFNYSNFEIKKSADTMFVGGAQFNTAENMVEKETGNLELE